MYDPHDDTELLLRSVRVERGRPALEVGCGAGLVAIRMAQLGARVVATDINREAARLARANARRNGVDLQVVVADLAKGMRLGRFDLVAFNPPYLPTQPDEKVPGPLNRAFDGGPEGREALQSFLTDVAKDPPRLTYVLTSSLQGDVEADFRAASLDARPVSTKQLSFEALTVYALSRRRTSRGNDEHHP